MLPLPADRLPCAHARGLLGGPILPGLGFRGLELLPCRRKHKITAPVQAKTPKCEKGLLRELNPGPLAPEARIIPLDQAAVTLLQVAFVRAFFGLAGCFGACTGAQLNLPRVGEQGGQAQWGRAGWNRGAGRPVGGGGGSVPLGLPPPWQAGLMWALG